jgi:uncharacterized protein (DUF433 family)
MWGGQSWRQPPFQAAPPVKHTRNAREYKEMLNQPSLYEVIDWTACPLVEIDPEKVGGTPVVKGTRIIAQSIVDDYDLGSPIEEIHENFPTLSLDTIKSLIAFAQNHHPVR